MTKSELIEIVAAKTDMTKSRAESVVNCVFDAMVVAMERGEKIELRGFGTLTVQKYKAYNGRNPLSGETVSVAEKRLPLFKASSAFKSLLNGTEKKNHKRGIG